MGGLYVLYDGEYVELMAGGAYVELSGEAYPGAPPVTP